MEILPLPISSRGAVYASGSMHLPALRCFVPLNPGLCANSRSVATAIASRDLHVSKYAGQTRSVTCAIGDLAAVLHTLSILLSALHRPVLDLCPHLYLHVEASRRKRTAGLPDTIEDTVGATSSPCFRFEPFTEEMLNLSQTMAIGYRSLQRPTLKTASKRPHILIIVPTVACSFWERLMEDSI